MPECVQCATRFESGKFCPACGRAVRGFETKDLLLGKTVDGFRFDAVLGRGASGFVYRATQLGLDRAVAIKVPTIELAMDSVAMRRFHREATALAKLVHPGVVAVHALGTLPDGRPYLAMDFLGGETLEAALDGGALAPTRAVALAHQIAEALAESHAHGIVHRDLKPDNVMLVHPQAGGERAVLIDFGIALPVAGADATRLTAGGGLVGTPHYMAPEQINGDEIDARTDVYALGATLYRMLTGQVPFEGTGVEVVVAHLARSVVPVRELAPSVPARLEAIVMRCLAKRAADRYASALEVATALGEVALELGASAATTTRKKRPTGADARRRAKHDSSSPTLPTARAAEPSAIDPLGSTRMRPPTARPQRRRSSSFAPALAALVAVAAIGGAAAFTIMDSGAATATASAGTDPGSSGSGSDSGTGTGTGSGMATWEEVPTRTVVVDDGGLSMRVVVPETIGVGLPVRFALEIWDADSAPVTAKEIVVTVESETGDPPRGFAASRTGLGGKVYGFTTRFTKAGHYKLRVFPPVGDATFVVDLDVGT